jgi:DNA mismatch endonuclease (patch repair protein)
MRANRKRDTGPELALRSALHRRRFRYRTGMAITGGGVRVVPDVVFSRRRVAVFVDGCWWHRCPEHGGMPRSNLDYWLPKLDRNVERDRLVNSALAAGGWTVVRIWEHDVHRSLELSVQRVVDALVTAR